MMKIAMVLLSVAIAAGISEVGLMLFFRNRFVTFDDERTLLYRYDRNLGGFQYRTAKTSFLPHGLSLSKTTAKASGLRNGAPTTSAASFF